MTDDWEQYLKDTLFKSSSFEDINNWFLENGKFFAIRANHLSNKTILNQETFRFTRFDFRYMQWHGNHVKWNGYENIWEGTISLEFAASAFDCNAVMNGFSGTKINHMWHRWQIVSHFCLTALNFECQLSARDWESMFVRERLRGSCYATSSSLEMPSYG